MSAKPTVPKGTRDFSSNEMVRREYIFDTIKSVFRLYGYQPIETPAMENISTLLGKYGDEGDKLLFRILNSGDFLADLNDNILSGRDTGVISSKIAGKGLRYDLTVPFARYVVQHRDEIVFPFKRYQIQPVWRADRPQKGRYREFFQCDADVIGSDSLLNEYELICLIRDIFSRLHVNVVIKINNRKILAAIAEYAGIPEKIIDITVAIDKIEKIGIEAVIEELKIKEISDESINKIKPFLLLKGDNTEKIESLDRLLVSETGRKGIEEIKTLFGFFGAMSEDIELDLTLARGLNYYTGAIIEVKSKDVAIGSICGGGRYDNLTGVFGLPGISGVGISFGADRIYDVMNQLDLFDSKDLVSTEVLVINFGEKETEFALRVVDRLRLLNVRTELYPDNAKMKKQFSYADNKNIPFIIMAGENEINENCITIKIMSTGEQRKIPVSGIDAFVKSDIRKITETGSIH